jgi:hypothetical protein
MVHCPVGQQSLCWHAYFFVSLAKQTYPVILSAARVSVSRDERQSKDPEGAYFCHTASGSSLEVLSLRVLSRTHRLHRLMTTPTQRPAVPRGRTVIAAEISSAASVRARGIGSAGLKDYNVDVGRGYFGNRFHPLLNSSS